MRWVLVLLLGCAPTETGNPFTAALSAHTTNENAVSLAEGGDIVIRSAWIGVGDIELELAADCDDAEMETVLPGPFIADLVGEPFRRTLDVPASPYCRVVVPLEPQPDPELGGSSIVIEGMTADGDPFVLRSGVDAELEVESRAAPFMLDDVVDELVLSFDLARWFAGVDVSAAVVGGDGTIRIDDANNEALLDVFEENVEDALELYDDADGDGRRDDDERVLAD